MVNSSQFKKLLFEHEVLCAMYDIRDHYLQKIVQEIYENIGQVLSLIRVQLTLLSNNNDCAEVSADEPGNLVGKAIRDLRALGRYLYPETEILAKLGLIQTLENDLKIPGIDEPNPVNIKGVPRQLGTGIELIVYRMLQEIICSIRKKYKDVQIKAKIVYEKDNVSFVFEYTGKPIERKLCNQQVDIDFSLSRLNLAESAELIDAKLQVNFSKAGKTRIKLMVPFKTSIYE